MMGSIARRYAKAIFSLADEEGSLEQTAADLSRLAETASDPDTAAALANPLLATPVRQAIARSLADTDAYHQSAINRKKIERLFGEAKTTLNLHRLRLRGLTGARDEFLLTAIVQNLKRLAKHVIRPPPEPTIA